MDQKRDLLRHAVATIAYRAAKAVRGASDEFGAFKAGPSTRTPLEIVAHMTDLFDWALSIGEGAERWQPVPPLAWEAEVARLFHKLGAFDAYLAADEPLGGSPERLLQGPIADALTHVGQLALLRRLAGAAVRGENYFKADIVVGRVAPTQTPPRREFD